MSRTLNPRFTEAGRIRIGDQAETERGRHPRKLNAFRITSANKIALDQLAQLYGGTPERWQDAPTTGHWQLYTESNCLDVVFPSLDAFSVLYEAWGNGFCKLRCDGERITHSATEEYRVGQECKCPSDEEMVQAGQELADTSLRCPIVARVSVILPGISGLGTWRLDTHGYYAASELKGLVAQLRALAQDAQPLPCLLRLEERVVQRLQKVGKQKGKLGTQRFAVPVLAPKYSYAQLARARGRPVPQLTAAAADALPLSREDIMARGSQAATDLFGDGAPPQDQHGAAEARHVLVTQVTQVMASKGYPDHIIAQAWDAALKQCGVVHPGDMSEKDLQTMLAKVQAWGVREQKAPVGGTDDDVLPF